MLRLVEDNHLGCKVGAAGLGRVSGRAGMNLMKKNLMLEEESHCVLNVVVVAKRVVVADRVCAIICNLDLVILLTRAVCN